MTAYERFQKDQTFRYRIIGMLAQQGYIFHGTNEKFDAFDSNQIKGGSRGREGYGAYFTNEAYKAEEYGNEFVILSTKGMNIVDSNNTFSQLNIISPYDIRNRIEQLNYQLDNVRNNRDYDAINNEIEQYKTYLNKLLSGIAYNDYELLSTYDFKPLNGDSTIYKILSFAYTKLSSTGMKSISQILLNMGIDGYIIGNVYVIINFEKLNNNIVKDKESLINSMINENKMKKVVTLKRKDVNEMVESIISRILMENSNECGMAEADNPDTSSEERRDNNSHYAVDKNGKILMGWDHGDKEPDQLKKYPENYFWKDVKDLGVDPYSVKIHTKGWLEKHGLDPNNEKNWDRTHTSNKGSVDFNEGDEKEDLLKKADNAHSWNKFDRMVANNSTKNRGKASPTNHYGDENLNVYDDKGKMAMTVMHPSPVISNMAKKMTGSTMNSIENEGVNEELHDVIHKEGDDWKIRGHKGKGDNEKDGDWKANYKSKASAEAALRGYFAQKESKNKKGNKVDEATYNMTDNGDEQSTLLKEISKLCDFGIDMAEKGNVTSASGAFIQIKELAHKIYLSNKDNAVYSY